MDAVSAASAIVALVFHCATVVKACDELRSKWKNAEQTLRSIATEGSTLRASLLQLQHLMMHDPAALTSRWDVESMLPQTFETAISSFNTVIDALLREMKKFDTKSTRSGSQLTRSLKFRVLWNENIMQDLLVHLRAHQQSLQFLMTILQMGSLSEIRQGIRKNERLLRTIARATKQLDQYESPQVESLKRKERRRGEEKTRSTSPDENITDNYTDSDDEPPAKRRSLSPEQEADFSYPSPGRTRSGTTYHPDTIEVQPVSPKVYKEVKDVRWDTEKSTKPTSTKGKHRDPTYESCYHRPSQQRSSKEKHRGDKLGRSHSPSSSSLGLSTPAGSFTNQAEAKGFAKSTSRNQRHFGQLTPPDTPNDNSYERSTSDTAGEEENLHTRKKTSTLQKPTPVTPSKSTVESDDEMQGVKEEPNTNGDQNNPKPQTIPSSAKYKSFQKAQFESDSEEENNEGYTYVADVNFYQKTPRRKPKKPALKTPPPKPKATEADAKKHRIPPGYSLKNWDPSEEPIMLLGSVFDANSLGKWIYDWTVYHHGPATPIADMAGELWLLLIQLAGKTKRAEDCMPRIRKEDNREMIEGFIESGERLTDKLKKLLRCCETPMLMAGKKNGKEQAQLRKNAGTEFVDSIFGKERQLEQTEKFMAYVRLWNMRFDANCEDILKRPKQ